MIRFNFIFSVLVVLICFRQGWAYDLKSSEEIEIKLKKNLIYSDMGKIPEFVGILNRQTTHFSTSDLYKFGAETKIAMTLELCEKYLDKIFGPTGKRSLKLKGATSLFDTRKGAACSAQLHRPGSSARFPHRYVLIGFVHADVYALVWSMTKAASTEENDELKNFWKTLK